MHGRESPRTRGKNIVLLDKYFSYDVGIIGGDSVDVTEPEVNERTIFMAQRVKVSMRKMTQLEEVAEYGPSWWTWR